MIFNEPISVHVYHTDAHVRCTIYVYKCLQKLAPYGLGSIVHCESKNWATFIFTVTVANVSRFLKFFQCRNQKVLQGNVATKLSYGGKFFILVMSHFFLIPTLKEF